MQFHPLDYSVLPEHIFEKICALTHPVWLDSGYPAKGHSRYDIISALPSDVLSTTSNNAEAVEALYKKAQKHLDQYKVDQSDSVCPFHGGLIGFLSYDLFACDFFPEQLSNLRKTEPILPEAHLGLYLWAVIYDHHRQSAQLVFHPECESHTRKAILDLLGNDKLETKGSGESVQHEFQLCTGFTASESKEKYCSSIDKIKEYILAGDVYQVNYAQHFSAQYKGMCSHAYLSQRQLHPAPYSAYIGFNKGAVLSHSPEEFIQVTGQEVQTQPIKGTAPRASDYKIDQRNAEVLQSSRKDRAENLMIVDLLRNDLGKACEPGSITVPKLFELQSFSNVHHLVSLVRGRLSKNTSALQLLRYCMPGGSITGAPKKRAMEIIHELEATNRSLYCGAIGYLSLCGRTHTNIAIRTMVADGQNIHCWGGGGIVADSDADQEYQETLFKVGPIMKSMEAAFYEKKDSSKRVS